MDVSEFVRVGSGMFTYSPAGFENLYSGDDNEYYLYDLRNEVLVRELIDSDLNISPNSVHIERAMTWLNQECKSHNWVDISGEFNSELLDASGFVFRNMIDESGYYRYDPSINNSGEYIPVVKSPEGGNYGSFVYKEEISPPPQRFIFADKNFLKDMNDIYYDVSRRINSKFNDLDEIEEEISLNLKEFQPYDSFEYYNSGIAIPAINRSSKEGKPYLDTKTESRTQSQIDANPNIDKTQGYGRFFLPRTKLQNFEFLPINYAGSYDNVTSFEHELVKAGNKQVSINDNDILFQSNTVNVTSTNLGENGTSKDGGILGNKELGGHWPGLNITPKQQKVYSLDKDVVGNKLLDFKEEMLNQSKVVYENCLKDYYINIESGSIWTDWSRGGNYFNFPKDDTLTSSLFQNNKFSLHHNYGLELLNPGGRIDSTFYADIKFESAAHNSLYNFIPCYITYVGKGTLRNKFGLNSKDLKCLIENYIDTLNNELGSFIADAGDVKLVVGRCLSKRSVEFHPLTVSLSTYPDGIVKDISIKDLVEKEASGDYDGVYQRARDVIIRDSVLHSIKNKNFIDIDVFSKSPGYNTSSSSNFLLETCTNFDAINDFNEESEVLYLAILVNNGEPLILDDIESYFDNTHDTQADNYKDDISSLVQRTTWGNNDMLHRVDVSPGGFDSARSRVDTGPLYAPGIPLKDSNGFEVGISLGHIKSFTKNSDLGSPKVVYDGYIVLDDEAVDLEFWISRTEYSEYPLGGNGTEGISFLFEGSSERRGVINSDVGGVGGVTTYSQISASNNPFYDRGINGSFTAPISVSQVENVTLETGDVSAKSIIVYGAGAINDYNMANFDDFFLANIDDRPGLYRYTNSATLKNIPFPLDNFDFTLRKNHPQGNLSASNYLMDEAQPEIDKGLYQYIGNTGTSEGFIQVDGEVKGGVGGLDSYEQAVFDSKYNITSAGTVYTFYRNPVPYIDITASCYSWKKTAQWYFDRQHAYSYSGNQFNPTVTFLGYTPTTTDGNLSASQPNMSDFNGIYQFGLGGGKLSDGYRHYSSVNSTMDTFAIGNLNNGVYDTITSDTIHYTDTSTSLQTMYWSAQGFYYNSWLKDYKGDNFIIHDKSPSSSNNDIHLGFGFLELKNPVAGDYDNNFTPDL